SLETDGRAPGRAALQMRWLARGFGRNQRKLRRAMRARRQFTRVARGALDAEPRAPVRLHRGRHQRGRHRVRAAGQRTVQQVEKGDWTAIRAADWLLVADVDLPEPEVRKGLPAGPRIGTRPSLALELLGRQSRRAHDIDEHPGHLVTRGGLEEGNPLFV